MPGDKPAAEPADCARPSSNPAKTKPEQLEREANALRANLRRRKQQAQARVAASADPVTATDSPDGRPPEA